MASIGSSKIVGEVNALKEDLLKELPVETDASVERCRDILSALQKTDMTLEILTETLVGASVNKLKTHKQLGSTVKILIQQWKQLAKVGGSGGGDGSGKATKRPSASSAASLQRRKSESSSHGDDDADDYNPESEWANLPSHRAGIGQKLYDVLFTSAKPALLADAAVAESVLPNLVGPRAAELERAIATLARNDRKTYMDKARSISFNLGKNAKLAASLLLGPLDATALVNMSPEELASDAVRQTRETAAQRLIDSKRLDWDTANETKINQMCGISGDALQASLFTCGRCKSIKTTSTQKQTRSADEPMTVFVLCLNCGKRWKC
jgi:transcription elongation factor S-II